MKFSQCFRGAVLSALLLAGSQLSFGANLFVIGGSDFLATLPGTTFGGAAFQGVPVGPGNTDTIVRRNSDVNITSGPGTTPVEMIALQLMSVAPVDFGLGVDFYFITLQSVRGGPASTGSMTITPGAPDDHLPGTPEGTFSSFFDVFFDVRKGALNGPIALSEDLVLSNQGAFWDATPAPLEVIVPGLAGDLNANLHTNKIQNTDTYQMDFFPIGPFSETHPSGAVHTVTGATIPEPETLLLIGAALLLLSRLSRRK
jgi:hypothetical protein